MADKKADDFDIEIIENGESQGDLFDFADEPAKKPDKKDKQPVDDGDDKPAKKPAKEHDVVAKMKSDLATAQEQARQRATAEAAARKKAAELEVELAAVRKQGRVAEGEAITSSKAAAQSEANRLKRELAAAWESGDYDKAADIQSQQARAQAILYSLDSQEATHKSRPEAETDDRRASEPAAPSDPLEAFIAKMPARMQTWFREHPEAFHDEEMRHRAFAADVAARKKGHAFDSDKYYGEINKYLGFLEDKEGEEDVADDEEDEKPQRKPAAPVSRGEAPSSSVNNQRVRLTREQVEIAESLGMTPQQYAKRMIEAKRDGKLT